MLRAGAILLTIWTGFKLTIALGILFMLLVLGKNSPALIILYGDAQGKGLDPRALTTINALAVVANVSIAALCMLSLAVIWGALVRRAVWGFWSLALALLFLDVLRWIGASFYYHDANFLADAAILLPTIGGLTCAAIEIFRKST
ncbi:MAG: hypothetical protein ACREFF_00305 [Candidatus Udaeobacter sp.]|jgi:hypothetical protein